jgi:hypothetical protein
MTLWAAKHDSTGRNQHQAAGLFFINCFGYLTANLCTFSFGFRT